MFFFNSLCLQLIMVSGRFSSSESVKNSTHHNVSKESVDAEDQEKDHVDVDEKDKNADDIDSKRPAGNFATELSKKLGLPPPK